MEFILSFSLILIGVVGTVAIAWAWRKDPDPVSDLLNRRSFVRDGILHVEGKQLTPDEMQTIKDAWERQYPFRRRAF